MRGAAPCLASLWLDQSVAAYFNTVHHILKSNGTCVFSTEGQEGSFLKQLAVPQLNPLAYPWAFAKFRLLQEASETEYKRRQVSDECHGDASRRGTRRTLSGVAYLSNPCRPFVSFYPPANGAWENRHGAGRRLRPQPTRLSLRGEALRRPKTRE